MYFSVVGCSAVDISTYLLVLLLYNNFLFLKLKKNYWLIFFFERERQREREKPHQFCCSTNWCTHWLILLCALTADGTSNLAVLGQYSNQLRYPARAVMVFKLSISKNGVLRSPTLFFFKILFVYFLERREGRVKGRERNVNVWLPLKCPLLGTWPTTQACALTGNHTSNTLVYRPALYPLSHTARARSPTLNV